MTISGAFSLIRTTCLYVDGWSTTGQRDVPTHQPDGTVHATMAGHTFRRMVDAARTMPDEE